MNVHVMPEPRGAPTPGAAKPGNLYADLESRSLWLGVSLSVDPTGSVLISDMLSLMDDIAAAEDNANAYTDSQIVTRATVVHTHTASQITDFTGAVTTVVNNMPGLNFIKGTILMFSGDPTDIGVGDWVGWALCNGLNGTPNLTDRFVMGYSGLAGHGMGQSNDPTTAKTSDHNGHTHPASPTTLTLAQIPSHSHTFGTLKGITTGSISPGGTHNHYITMCSVNGAGAYRPKLELSGNSVNVYTETEPNHSHAITALDVQLNSGATGLAGGTSPAHSHAVPLDGAHSHTLATAQLREAIPFYALAFVIKL